MKQQALLILVLVLAIGILIGLNAVSYTKLEQVPDSELEPNRSSYNSGTTGTSALFSLLTETGNKVTRWQQSPSALTLPANNKIRSFVMIGDFKRTVSEEDAEKLLNWVARGNRLVLIDRYPTEDLLNADKHWNISVVQPSAKLLDDKDLLETLTKDVPAAKPVQPTALMLGINAVQPSSFASSIAITYVADPPVKEPGIFGYSTATPTPTPTPFPTATPKPAPSVNATRYANAAPAANRVSGAKNSVVVEDAPPPPAKLGSAEPPPEDYEADAEEYPTAPVIHLGNADKDLLIDVPHGAGQIVFLSDPYIVSNAGIKLVDNATLAVNLIAVADGTIAFDEYHQGYGSENTIFSYFAGTPVIAIFAQAALLVGFLLWTQGRRFARAVPLPVKDRRSKLEYVSAMADLQQNTRAYDLVIENVYLNIRRGMVRLAGSDNTIPKKDLAEAMALRSGISAQEIYILMSKCKDIIAGEPTNAKETMRLVADLRNLETKLGLHGNRKAGREVAR